MILALRGFDLFHSLSVHSDYQEYRGNHHDTELTHHALSASTTLNPIFLIQSLTRVGFREFEVEAGTKEVVNNLAKRFSTSDRHRADRI